MRPKDFLVGGQMPGLFVCQRWTSQECGDPANTLETMSAQNQQVTPKNGIQLLPIVRLLPPNVANTGA